MKPNEIVKMARDFKKNWHTNDPYEIAEKLGIRVIYSSFKAKEFTAHTLKMSGYPTVICINDKFSDHAKRVLCAHELGHVLLHEDGINHFAVTSQNVMTNVEFEANLFAIALLVENDINSKLIMDLELMNNYVLKSIIDYNLD